MGKAPLAHREQSRIFARHAKRTAEEHPGSVHIPTANTRAWIFCPIQLLSLLCDCRAGASLLCPWKTDKRTNQVERSGEASSQGEHSQFGHVRGDVTGEQKQVVPDALGWSHEQ